MAVIKTKPFGEIEVSDKQKIEFVRGIFGFDNLVYYYLLDSAKNPGVFYWLQSAEDPSLAFVLIRPEIFKPDYELVIADYELELVEASSVDDVLSFAIVTIPPDNPRGMTANLLGPIVINPENRKAIQAISLREDYTTSHKIIDEMQRSYGYNLKNGVKVIKTREVVVR